MWDDHGLLGLALRVTCFLRFGMSAFTCLTSTAFLISIHPLALGAIMHSVAMIHEVPLETWTWSAGGITHVSLLHTFSSRSRMASQLHLAGLSSRAAGDAGYKLYASVRQRSRGFASQELVAFWI